MSVQIATTHFLAKDGHPKLNCAQAVLKAFQHQLNIPDNIIESFSAHGGGRAPEGHCGAVFAAEFIFGLAGILDPEVNAVTHLESLAGSAVCKDIKAAKQLSCLGCVQTCTAYVEEKLFETMSLDSMSQ